MIVAVGSTNPTKIEPVKKIFAKHFKNFKAVGVKVASGVREQPLSYEETFQGALARAKASLAAVKGAKYGVGIEGGLHKHDHGWHEQAFVVILDKKGNIGVGSSAGMNIPTKVVKIIEQGKTIDDAFHKLTGIEKLGSTIGMFGYLTRETVTRAQAMEHGVAFALARFLHKDFY